MSRSLPHAGIISVVISLFNIISLYISFLFSLNNEIYKEIIYNYNKDITTEIKLHNDQLSLAQRFTSSFHFIKIETFKSIPDPSENHNMSAAEKLIATHSAKYECVLPNMSVNQLLGR